MFVLRWHSIRVCSKVLKLLGNVNMGKNWPLADIQRAQIFPLHGKGYTEWKVSEVLKCSKTAVHNVSANGYCSISVTCYSTRWIMFYLYGQYARCIKTVIDARREHNNYWSIHTTLHCNHKLYLVSPINICNKIDLGLKLLWLSDAMVENWHKFLKRTVFHTSENSQLCVASDFTIHWITFLWYRTAED